MIIEEENYLAHYGILRRSGRYPWGSGGNATTRARSMFDHIQALKEKGMSDSEIMRGFGMNSTDFRAAKSVARNIIKQSDIAMAQRLKDKGYSNVAIGKRMGINESSVRSLLAPGAKDKADLLTTTSNMLREQVDSKGLIQIGSGVESHIGVTETHLKTAIAMLKEEGYTVHSVQVDQLGTGGNQKTVVKVLAPPGTSYLDVKKNADKIQLINAYSEDGGRSFLGIQPPLSVDPKRIDVKYKEHGGADADGVIYVRPGVSDVSLGSARYAQVRVKVGDTHYMKGMAVYKDDLPKGIDLQFNTNKSDTGNKLDAFKALKDDPDNPFGATIRQRIDPQTKKVTSAMNIVGSPHKEGSGEEGSWDNWSRNLPSQFLSKQSHTLAKTQLDMTYERKKAELDEIKKLTNPAVRRKLLQSYADDADSSATHLKAAPLPGQRTHVLLPNPKLKDTEVYAPNYKNGERVVLVRFPHGGTFELPELTVNNRHESSRKLLGPVKDAVAVNPKVAQRLSGADFDGDTILVIPNRGGKVKTTKALEGLKNFDPMQYKLPEGQTFKGNKQQLMGDVSNLITDMTIKGANTEELARAVKHSMVVIDAEKHNLDHKLSAEANGIKHLKEKYQGRTNAGASTLISRAKSPTRVPERKPRPASKGGPIDRETGKKVFVETGATYVNRQGKTVLKKDIVRKLDNTDDAHTLSSGTVIERIYADHSNRLKALANAARKEQVHTKSTPYSPSAKLAYSSEVESLNAKLNLAKRNRPLERQAQLLANQVAAAKKQAHPEMDATERKRIEYQALAEARTRVNAKALKIEITPKEWDAIQAGAISNHKLEQILDKADLDQVKRLATPRENLVMTSVKQRRAEQMLASGYTQAEVAEALGVALSTLKSSIST